MPPRIFAAPPPLHLALIEIKQGLRREARARRRRLADACPGAAERAAQVWLRSQPLAACVSVYLATGAELDPAPLARVLAGLGVDVALPAVVRYDQPLVFRRTGDGGLVPDAAGLLAPPAHAREVRPDVVFTPLLAFDRRGGRLGQGGGFYDRTLAALRASGPVRAVGLAYAGQEVERVPCDDHDAPLDGVLTEEAYLDFTGDR